MSQAVTAVDIALSAVSPDPEQHRKVFTEEDLRGLAESIVSQGQITAVKVRPDPQEPAGRYVLIDGERRYRACVLAGLPTIRAEVHDDLTEAQIADMQGAANLSRRDVEPCAAGRALRRSMDALKAEKPWLSEDEARKVVQEVYGVSGQFAVPRLKLLLLPQDVQDLVDKGSVGVDAANALLPLVEKGETAQAVRFALSVQAGKLRASDVSNAVATYLGEKAQGALFGADEGKATKEQRATRDALTRAVWNWERGTSLVFGEEKQEGFDLGTLGAEELAIHEAKVAGLVRSLQSVLSGLLEAQGKVPDLAPEPVEQKAPPPPIQPLRQARASVLGLEAARAEPGAPVAYIRGQERWVWAHGIAEASDLGQRLSQAGAVWTRSRGGCFYAPGGRRAESVRSVLASAGVLVVDPAEPETVAAVQAAG